jgi:DHA2 family multidrug resistance protein
VTRGEPNTEGALAALRSQGLSADQALGWLDRTLDAQARMLSTIDLFWLSGVLFLALAVLVWLANAPRAAAKMAATTGSHE